MDQCYDVVVIGLGVMGSSCFYHLTSMGYKVLGIEQYQSPHNKGSSGGDTRSVRLVYYEDNVIADCLRKSVSMWQELQQKTDLQVFRKMDGVIFGNKNSHILENPATKHPEVKSLSDLDLQSKYGRYFRFTPNTQGIEDTSGGIGYISNAIRVFLELGTQQSPNSRIVNNCKFIKYEETANKEILVYTDQGIFNSKKIILSMGLWMQNYRDQLRILPHHLYVEKIVTYWVKASEAENVDNGFPWFFTDSHGLFLFVIPHQGEIKIGFHKVGPIVVNSNYVEKDSADNYEVYIRSMLKQYLPHLSDAPITRKDTCFYTMTSDENFIIDFHPTTRNVVFLSACSGHGFKFSILFGQIAAKMIQTGQIQIEQFRVNPAFAKL